MSFSAKDILDVTAIVTKKWAKQRKAEERGRRSAASRVYVYSDRINFTDVANEILPPAYEHASGGKYTVSKRHLFYSCRESFKEETGREVEFGYFANTILVQFLNRNPELTAGWRITADPRGTLIIPNAAHEVRVPVGTVQIDDHMRGARQVIDPFDIDAELDVEWPSLAHGQRYQAVLYIEKEGFGPIMKEARIAERFDVAVMSCKGQSVVAARKFVDHVCAVGNNCPLLVVHDLDKSGFEISQRLTTVSDWAEECDRVAYRFNNDIDVIDVGLRLKDVQKYGLKGERCRFRGGFASDSIATDEEKEYLRSGRRVELNELPVPLFVEWLEGELKRHLPERLIPNDDILADAYRRASVVARFNHAIEKIRDKAIEKAQDTEIPKTLRRKLKKAMKKSGQPWDRTLYDMIADDLESLLSEEDDE